MYMVFKLGLAQTGYPADGDVLAQIEAYAAKAASREVDLLAFPEALMCPRPLQAPELLELAEPLDGPFMQAVSNIATRHGIWIVGTMYETNPNGAPYNTAFVVGSTGTICGTYRKCHLYDAHGVFESHRTSAGNALMKPIRTPFGNLALGICYDLRFPELARQAALDGANLLLLPACWYDGPQKPEHWETLLKARAIENEMFVAGICHAGSKFVEHSLVADPLGHVITPHAQGETLVLAQIDTASVQDARTNMPVFEHRRPELYR
jgi:predicted amidohydrolase